MSMRMIAALALLALIGVEAQTSGGYLANGRKEGAQFARPSYSSCDENWRVSAIQCGLCGGGVAKYGAGAGNIIAMVNPCKTFQMGGKAFSCNFLQAGVSDDVDVSFCDNAKRIGFDQGCCANAPVYYDNSVKDLNPSCDLCGVKGVHSTMKGEAVKGDLGNMNCQGLSDAMKAKTISGNLCKPATLDPYRLGCCNANPGSNTGGDNTGGGNTASTKRPTKRPTNQATQPTKFPTKRPTNQATRPTPKANRQRDKKISGASGGAAGRVRALDGEESTTSGSVGISSGLMGILVALVGLCIAR